jgi:hypothetical protein
MTEASLLQWSDEVVAESFRSEIRARFEAHNVASRARDAAELEVVLLQHPEKRGQPGYEVRDSGAWAVYQASEIRIDRNSVTIVLPRGIAIGVDLVYLFDHTAMAWSRALIGATIVDGEARPTIEITLVATWTDAMDAAWRKEGNDRKQVLVELYEDDVHALCGLVAAQLATVAAHTTAPDAAGPMPTIRDRLKLALEALP